MIKLHPIAYAVQLVLLGMLVTSPVAHAQSTAAGAASHTAATRQYDIPAGPLGPTISRFASAAGVAISFDASGMGNAASPGLKGTYTVEQGFANLLQGSGWEAAGTGNGNYVLRKSASVSGAASDSVLPAVIVTGQQETATGPVAGFVAKRSITATKTDTPLIESPQSISVVTRDQMDAQNVQSVSEAVRYTAGVMAESNGPDPRADNIVIRGFSSSGRDTFRDGLRSYAFNNQGGTVVEAYGLERIEILRGPSSILYGQGGAGGIVNLVSKHPTAEPLRELQMQLGNYGRRQLAGDFGGKLTDDGEWTYRLTALVRESDTFIDYVNDDRTFIAPALTWKPNADTSLTLLADYQINKRGQGYQALPRIGTLVSNPNGRIPTSRFVGEPNFDKFDQERASIGYQFEHRFNDQITFRQNMRYQDMDTDVNTIYMLGWRSDLQNVSRLGSISTENVKNGALDNQLQLKWQHGVFEHTTLVGVDIQSMRSDVQETRFAFSDLNLYNPIYGSSPGAVTLRRNVKGHLDQMGVYIQDQIKIDKNWVTTLGLRHDSSRQGLDNYNLINGATTRSSVKDSATTGRIGLVYLSPTGFAPYLSYSESFVPVVDTFANGTPFKPETGQQYEAGIRYQPSGSATTITASVYDLTRQNVTTADLVTVGARTQLGEVNSRGVELEAKTNLTKGWDLIANYSHGRVKLTKNNSGNQGNLAAGTPQDTASVWGQYTLQSGGLAGLSVGVGLRYVGFTYGNDQNTVKVPAYTLTDLAVRYDFSRLGWVGWRGAFNVSNLFDKEYVATCAGYTGDGCKYGYRRSAIATLSYHW